MGLSRVMRLGSSATPGASSSFSSNQEGTVFTPPSSGGRLLPGGQKRVGTNGQPMACGDWAKSINKQTITHSK